MEWARLDDRDAVRRQRQATRSAAKTTAVAGRDKNNPSWRLLAVENTWIITVLFSPVIGSLIDTVALIDLSKSSLIIASSRSISSETTSSYFTEFFFTTSLLFWVLAMSFFSDTFAIADSLFKSRKACFL